MAGKAKAPEKPANVKDVEVDNEQHDDQTRGTSDHGVAGANTGTQSGVPADRGTVDPHSEEGIRRREAAEGHRQSVGGPHRTAASGPPSDGD